MKNLRRTDDTSSATQHLGRLTLNQRGEQLVSGESTGTTLLQADRGVKGVQQDLGAVSNAEDAMTTGNTVERSTGKTAGRQRGGQRRAQKVSRRSLGTARDGRASVRSQRASKAVRGGVLAQSRRAAQKAAAQNDQNAGEDPSLKDAAALIGTSAPRLGLAASRAAGAVAAIVRAVVSALVSAFTASPVLLISVAVIALVMALVAAVSWLLPSGVRTVAVTGTWANPVMGTITSPYGYRVHPISGVLKLHDGTDIGAPNGTPVNAACSGIVVTAGPSTGFGDHFVVIDCGGAVVTKYGHMDSQHVEEGNQVAAGQQVGTVGSQGYSTGNHLHFIVATGGSTTDPEPFFADHGVILGKTPLDQLAGGDPGGTAKEYAKSVVADDAEFMCLDLLWTNESNWNPHADNPTSSAYGIPQALPGEKMASAGADWKTNPRTQVTWGLGYITGRYGTPCKAWAFWQSNAPHWY